MSSVEQTIRKMTGILTLASSTRVNRLRLHIAGSCVFQNVSFDNIGTLLPIIRLVSVCSKFERKRISKKSFSIEDRTYPLSR